jgi:hypothetical protein
MQICPLTITFIFILILLSYIIYSYSSTSFVGRHSLNYNYPIFNFGTREWYPTHLQSYDVRGDIPVAYYPSGTFNQPEWPVKTYYPPPPIGMFEPNFYTYEYVNPLQGFYPPIYNSNYSVPFKVDNKNSNSGGYKPILDQA